MRQFPPGFLWGTASAAYQIDGAHDTHRRNASIPSAIPTGSKCRDFVCA